MQLSRRISTYFSYGGKCTMKILQQTFIIWNLDFMLTINGCKHLAYIRNNKDKRVVIKDDVSLLRCIISFVPVSSALLRATFSRCHGEIIWLNYIMGATHTNTHMQYTRAASHTSYRDEDKSHNFSQCYTPQSVHVRTNFRWIGD